MKIHFTDIISGNERTFDTIICLAQSDATGLGKTGAFGSKLDKEHGGFLSRAIKSANFKGKKDETLLVAAPNDTHPRILLVGIGEAKNFEPLTAESLGGTVAAMLATLESEHAASHIEIFKGFKLDAPKFAAHFALGLKLRQWSFGKYKTLDRLKGAEKHKKKLKDVTLVGGDSVAAKNAYMALESVAEGVFLTRHLVSEPPNVIYPVSFVEYVQQSFKDLPVAIEILGEKQMKKLGMGSLLGVGQGSDRESQLLVIKYDGGIKGDAPLAFVGKGVTFDTGGISIKPSAGMDEMKWDMAGAGAVVGAMRALAGRGARANIVGVCGLVENMPDGMAQRPGDIVTSMSGITIEVLNTDAEGRLVLADALWYTQEVFKPHTIIDLATLTGAVMIALGFEHAGLMSDDETLVKNLLVASKSAQEPLWRLPLGDTFDKDVESSVADLKNISDHGKAGSSIGAAFLKRFIKNGVAWAHLDIAGVAWSKKDKPTIPKGATAYGVRLLDTLVAQFYEK